MDIDAEILLAKTKVEMMVDAKLAEYKAKYPNGRNLDTAKEFLDGNYEDFRKVCGAVSTDIFHKMIHEHQFDNESVAKVMDANQWNIGKLYVSVMNESGDKRFATK
jgi:hypothetical protein